MEPSDSQTPRYQSQDRGGADAYASYYAGMDSTMRQKLAFVGAHFLLDPGARIADMGCGSGSGTYQLALLNPQIRVIGVDINPEAVRIAGEKYKLPNLSFMVGDVADPLFADDPLDGVLSSSTLHHVYTFNGYSRDAVRRAMASHMRCLREGGVFVLRDFVRPQPGIVLLELSAAPGAGSEIAGLSDADLLVRFARTARPLDKRCGPGFFLEEIEPLVAGTRLFRLPSQWAAEFVLRKDYRRDWDVELLEEYTYFTAEEFAAEMGRAGGRLLSAEPYWNPWIVKNRFAGKFCILDETGHALGWPATNFVAVAQRVAPGASMRLVERRPSDRAPSFLALDAMKGESVFDLVRRPNPVCDLLAWRRQDGRLRVVARHGYPRPITCAVPRGPAMIDGAAWGGYLIEPVTGTVTRDASADAIAGELAQRAGIARDAVGATMPGLAYYPSPGGIDERVTSLFVELAMPVAGHALSPALSGLSTAGAVREFDAQDLLRAAHVGVLPEARLEMNVYALMRKLGITPDPYIGEEVELADAPLPAGTRRASVDALLARPAVTPFVPTSERANYLRLIRAAFADQTEEDGLPRTLADIELELVVPRTRSVNTVVALPVLRSGGEVLVGLETRLLPVPQRHDGNARVLVAPAWRLRRDVASLAAAKAFVAAELGASPDEMIPLGAAYFPSSGLTPERVHPFVVRGASRAPYDFVPLAELRDSIARLRDGHLLVAVLRLIHALAAWT